MYTNVDILSTQKGVQRLEVRRQPPACRAYGPEGGQREDVGGWRSAALEVGGKGQKAAFLKYLLSLR